MTVAVAGCVAQAEGEEIIRRAPVVDLVVGPQSYHRLPDLLAREQQDRRDRVSRRRQVLVPPTAEHREDEIARYQRIRHRAGGLRQVLHLLRRALHAGRGSLPSGRKDPRRSGKPRRRRGARGDVDRPERQRVPRRRSRRPRLHARRACSSASPNIPGIARLRYTTSHPCDVDDDLIAVHRDLRATCAAASSAGAVRLGSHSWPHEPPPHARGLSAHHRPAARGAARSSRSPPISSSGFRARPRRISATRCASWTRSNMRAPTRSVIRSARERPAQRWTGRSRRR